MPSSGIDASSASRLNCGLCRLVGKPARVDEHADIVAFEQRPEYVRGVRAVATGT